MEMTWTPGVSTVGSGSRGNKGVEHVDSRWCDTTKYPQVRRVDQYTKKTGICTEDANEPGYANGARDKGAFNLGVERTRQRNALRNEVYAQMLGTKMETGRRVEGWEIALGQILRAIDQLPWTPLEGRIYVCEDGETGIVWEDGNRRVEISAGVLPDVEYLVWEDKGNVGTESEWDVEGGQPLPTELKAALEKK